jgi:hypothetical protein
LEAALLALHALWTSSSYFALWAEDSDGSARRNEPVAPGEVAVHPFAVKLQGLKFPTRLFGCKGFRFDNSAVVLELPSVAHGPLASAQLGADGFAAPEDGESVVLQPWRVPVQTLTAHEVLPNLVALSEIELPPKLKHGASFLVFAGLARLAAEAIASGSVLPTAKVPTGTATQHGQWQPFFGAPRHARRLQELIDLLPAAALGERSPGGEVRTAASVCHEFLNHCTHGTVRHALARHDLLPRAGLPKNSNPSFPAWMTSLSGASRPMPASEEEATGFQAELEAWYRLATSPGRLFRICFLVRPPQQVMALEDDEGHELTRDASKENPWKIEICIQADDDPELVIDADRIWLNRNNKSFAKDLGIEDPPGLLRAGLDRALEVCPELDTAMRKARVTQLELNTKQAHRFMKETAPRLTELGMTVVLPPWWAQRHTDVGLALVASDQIADDFRGGLGGALDKDSLCRFQWQVALGDQRVSAKELYRLAAEKQPLVKVGGQWVEVPPDQLQTALGFLKKKGDEGSLSVTEVMRKGLLQEKVPLPLVEFNLEGMLATLTEADGAMEEVDEPDGFVGELRPYQRRGLGWLRFLGRLGVGACLADDMGLGKTIQMLALLLDDLHKADEAGDSLHPTLLVSPMSVVGNWQRESEKFGPRIKVMVHHGSERLAGEEFVEACECFDLVLTTYGLVLRDKDLLSEVPWKRIVLDEAQNIKNPAARQTQAVRSLESEQRVALTGTPVENHLTELWSIMEFLNPGLLGSQRDYKSRFATPIERHGDRDASDLLRKLTGPFILRRLKSDRSIIKELPEKIEAKVYCNLTKEQASTYQAVVDDMMKQINSAAGIARKGLILTTLMKLKQICNHPHLVAKKKGPLGNRSGKLARLEELLEVIMEGDDKMLIFTQFSSWGQQLADHLVERFDGEVFFLHGGTPKKTRDKMVETFQTPEGPRIFVLSLKAGGVGLNLTAANQIVHFDRWWNPAVEDQASDRAYRIGQERTVQVRKFVCLGTLEERIDKMIEQKKALADAIIGTGEGWLTELNTDQLAELFKLSRDAVSET